MSHPDGVPVAARGPRRRGVQPGAQTLAPCTCPPARRDDPPAGRAPVPSSDHAGGRYSRRPRPLRLFSRTTEQSLWVSRAPAAVTRTRVGCRSLALGVVPLRDVISVNPVSPPRGSVWAPSSGVPVSESPHTCRFSQETVLRAWVRSVSPNLGPDEAAGGVRAGQTGGRGSEASDSLETEGALPDHGVGGGPEPAAVVLCHWETLSC